MKFVSYVDFIDTNINFHRRVSHMGIFITHSSNISWYMNFCQ